MVTVQNFDLITAESLQNLARWKIIVRRPTDSFEFKTAHTAKVGTYESFIFKIILAITSIFSLEKKMNKLMMMMASKE